MKIKGLRGQLTESIFHALSITHCLPFIIVLSSYNAFLKKLSSSTRIIDAHACIIVSLRKDKG